MRRNTAQELLTRLGPDDARAMMAHDPNSTVLERYYTTGRSSLIDLTAVATGADDVHANVQKQALAVTKLNSDQLQRLSSTIHVLVEQLRETDEDYPHHGTIIEKKNRDRVLKRAAFRSLMKDLVEERNREITVDDANARIEDIQKMSHTFNQRVLKVAREFVGEDQEPHSESETSGGDRDLSFLEATTSTDQIDVCEEDAEEQFREAIENGQPVQVFTDEVDDLSGEIETLDYATAARAAMEVWLSVGMAGSDFGSHHLQHHKVPCPLCQEDDTVSDEMKAKTYHPSKLGRHKKSEFHSGYKRFMRRAVNLAQANEWDGVQCEICARLAPEGVDIPPHATIKTLARHIESSTATTLRAAETDHRWWADFDDEATRQLSIDHDNLKRELGWYEPEFKGDLDHKATVKGGERDRDYRRAAETEKAMKFADIKKLERPIPIPAWPGLQFGSIPGELIERIRRESSYFVGERPDPEYYVPQNRESLFRIGPRDEVALPPIPPRYEGLLISEPATPKNLEAARDRLLKRQRKPTEEN